MKLQRQVKKQLAKVVNPESSAN